WRETPGFDVFANDWIDGCPPDSNRARSRLPAGAALAVAAGMVVPSSFSLSCTLNNLEVEERARLPRQLSIDCLREEGTIGVVIFPVSGRGVSRVRVALR